MDLMELCPPWAAPGRFSTLQEYGQTRRDAMALVFEWDTKKARSNLAKHGISFDEASTAFGDPLSIAIGDPLHSEREDRYVLIGCSFANTLLVVVHTERGGRIRIISARPATRRERLRYEEVEP